MANEINGYYNFKSHIKKKQDFKIICLIYKINKPQTKCMLKHLNPIQTQ